MTEAERAERRAQFFAMVAEMGPEPAGGALAWTVKLFREAKRNQRRTRLAEGHSPEPAARVDEPNPANGPNGQSEPQLAIQKVRPIPGPP
jgi:hypothetical protein